jgi:hypothetical protein
MIPKVRCALDAVRAGVEQVHVIDGRGRHALCSRSSPIAASAPNPCPGGGAGERLERWRAHGARARAASLARPEALRPGRSGRAILRVLSVPAEAAGRRLDVFVTSQLKRTSRTRAQHHRGRGVRSEGRRRGRTTSSRGRSHLALARAIEARRDATARRSLKTNTCSSTSHARRRSSDGTLPPPHGHQASTRRTPDEFVASCIGSTARPAVSSWSPIDRIGTRVRACSRSHAARTATIRSARRTSFSRGVPNGGLDLHRSSSTPKTPARQDAHRQTGVGRAATTDIEVLEERAGRARALRAHTGRQHQIRVHLAALGAR